MHRSSVSNTGRGARAASIGHTGDLNRDLNYSPRETKRWELMPTRFIHDQGSDSSEFSGLLSNTSVTGRLNRRPFQFLYYINYEQLGLFKILLYLIVWWSFGGDWWPN